MNLAVVTPEGTTTVTDVDKVSLPGSSGRFTVLRGHAPLVSTLARGTVRYSRGGEEAELPVGSGVVEVARNEVCLMIEQ